MTELDTSAYTPAQENEEETLEEEDVERTRFQIPLDNSRDERMEKHLKNLDEMIRDDNELKEHINEIKNLLEEYNCKKFLKMYQYRCDRCNQLFDTKQAAGVHKATNPNCNNADNPWNQPPASYTAVRVDERH